MKKIIKISVLLALLLSCILSLAKVYMNIPQFNNRIAYLDIDADHNLYILLNTRNKDYIMKLNRQLETVFIYSQDKLSRGSMIHIEDVMQNQGNIYFLTTITDINKNIRQQKIAYLRTDKITSKPKEIASLLDSTAVYYKKLEVSGDKNQSLIKAAGTNGTENQIKETVYQYIRGQKESSKVLEEKTYSCENTEGIYSIFYYKNHIGCLSKTGQLYLNEKNQMKQQQIKDLNDGGSAVLMVAVDHSDGLYAVMQNKRNIRKIDLEHHTSTLVYWGEANILENMAAAYQNCYKLAFLDEKTLAAATDMDKDTPFRIIVTNNGIDYKACIESFTMTFDRVIVLALRHFMIYFIIFMGIIAGVFIFIKLIQESKTILFKTIICVTPMISAGFIVMLLVLQAWYSNVMRQDALTVLKNNANLTENRLNAAEIESFETNGTYGDLSHQNLEKVLYQEAFYSQLILVRDGSLFTGISKDYPLFYPLDVFKNSNELNVYESALKEKAPKLIETIYPNGQYDSWIVPILNPSNDVIALLELGSSKADTARQEQTFIKVMSMITAGVLIIILIPIVLVLRRILKPVYEIEASLQEFAATKQRKKINYYSKDEFYRMSQIVNNILEETQVQLYNLSRINNMYFRFFPERFFSLLKKKSVADIDLGDSIAINRPVAILSMKYEDIKEINKNFSIINRLVNEYDGVISINDRHLSNLTAIYSENTEAALEAQLMTVSAIEAENVTNELQFVTILDKMEVQLEVGGDSKRLSIVILSKRLDCIYEHMPLFSQLGCMMLVTKEILDEMADKKQHTYRYIGYILDQEHQKIHLYDLFEADRQSVRELKKETQFIFNKALECFYKRDFYQAKNLFSIVIRENKEDEIARWYVFRCDALYKKEIVEDEKSLSLVVEK